VLSHLGQGVTDGVIWGHVDDFLRFGNYRPDAVEELRQRRQSTQVVFSKRLLGNNSEARGFLRHWP
jgi:hypothetical protein